MASRAAVLIRVRRASSFALLAIVVSVRGCSQERLVNTLQVFITLPQESSWKPKRQLLKVSFFFLTGSPEPVCGLN